MLALRPKLARGWRRSGQDAAKGPTQGLQTPLKLGETPFLIPHLDSGGELCGGPVASRGQMRWCAGREWRHWMPPAGPSVSLSRGQRRAATICPSALAGLAALGERQLRPTLTAFPAAPRPALSRRGCEHTARARKSGYVLASRDRARLPDWPPTPLVSAGAAPVGWNFQPRPRRRLGGAGFRGEWNRTCGLSRGGSAGLRGGRAGWGTEPRREGVTGPESSVPGLICSCSDFHCGTFARNRVSSGGKRRFPPRGADKDLINPSESRAFWPGAGALAPGSLGDPATPSRPQLSFPRHCGAPRPETGEGAWAPGASELPRVPVSFEGGKARKRP